MKSVAIGLLAFLACLAFTTQDMKIGFDPVDPAGLFGTQDLAIRLVKAKNGRYTVSGVYNKGGLRRIISGTMTKSLKISAEANARGKPSIPIDGNYKPGNDTVVITAIGGKPETHVLERIDTTFTDKQTRNDRKIRPGTYRGETKDPDSTWELNVTASSGPDFNVNGFVEFLGRRQKVSGTLRANGTFKGTAEVGGIDKQINGAYNFVDHDLSVELSRVQAVLKRGVAAQPTSTFGLVSKVLGRVDGPVDWAEGYVEGGMSEDRFWVEMRRKPPYNGRTRIEHNFSTTMGSTLKPGQVVELKCWSAAEKEGPDAPLIGGGATWYVEGDGAEVLERSTTFAGFSSDGKFHARSEAKTVFRVLSKGTITIVTGNGGYHWGKSDNRDNSTYIYKFRERPTTNVGGGG